MAVRAKIVAGRMPEHYRKALRRLFTISGKSAIKVSEDLGLSRTTVAHYLTGAIEDPPFSRVLEVVRACGGQVVILAPGFAVQPPIMEHPGES